MSTFAVFDAQGEGLATGEFDSTAHPHPFTMVVDRGRRDAPLEVVGQFDAEDAVLNDPELALRHLAEVMERHLRDSYFRDADVQIAWAF